MLIIFISVIQVSRLYCTLSGVVPCRQDAQRGEAKRRDATRMKLPEDADQNSFRSGHVPPPSSSSSCACYEICLANRLMLVPCPGLAGAMAFVHRLSPGSEFILGVLVVLR